MAYGSETRALTRALEDRIAAFNNTRRGRSRGGGALSQGREKILGSAFPGIVISWKHLQLNNIIGAIFHT